MSITPSRRGLLRGAFGAAGLTLAGTSLAACSTSSDDSGDAKGKLVLWIWPDGFGKELMAGVKKKFPDTPVRQDVIGGDFKQKLTTTFTAKSGLPAITGIKGEDIAFFRSQADYFEDLNDLGAEKLKGDYLDWKWQQGTTTDGKLIGFPIDIGPTALFYRNDVFAEAGLPSEPDALGAAITTWDDYIEVGKQMIGKLPDTFLVRNLGSIFGTVLAQSGQSYIDEKRVFIGADDHVRAAWDVAAKVQAAGINGAQTSNAADSAAAVNAGKLPADLGASWHLSDLVNDAAETSGKWRVCPHPGKAINNGGSFLAIPKGSETKDKAFEVITWMLNADNQALEFTDKGNFPSTPATYEMPALTGGVEFLGGQKSGEVFGKLAKDIRPVYQDPMDDTVNGPYSSELENVELKGKDPEQAWNDAVEAAKKLCEQNGITVK